jgi:glycerophosphoryl diester phosphodiesterase
MLDAPENTLPGIDAAGLSGADSVEMDVQWTNSSFPVLMHDATVDRTTNGTGAVSSMGLSQVGALLANQYDTLKVAPAWVGNSSFVGLTAPKVPYAGDFIPRVAANDLNLVLDIHMAPTQLGMDKLVIYINRSNWAERTLIMGTPAWVQSMHGWYPNLHYGVIEYPTANVMRTGEYLESVGASMYITPIGNFLGNANLVNYYHDYGIKVYTWTSDSTQVDVLSDWQSASNKGVDGLITNQPKLAREEITQCKTVTIEPTTQAPATTSPPVPSAPASN